MKGNKKRLIILGVAVTLCCAVLRSIQLIFMTDSATGFFHTAYEGFAGFVTLATVAAVLGLTVCCRIYGAEPLPDNRPTVPFALGSFLMAAAVIYQTLFSAVGKTVPPWQLLSMLALGTLAAVLFFAQGLSAFKELHIPPIFDLVFVIFWIIRVIIVFSSYISVSTIAENAYELASLCSALIFFLNAAKIRNKVNGAGGCKSLFALSALCFILSICFAVPQILSSAIRGDNLHTSSAAGYIDLCIAVYIVGFCYNYFKKQRQEEAVDTGLQMSMFDEPSAPPALENGEDEEFLTAPAERYETNYVFEIEPEEESE